MNLIQVPDTYTEEHINSDRLGGMVPLFDKRIEKLIHNLKTENIEFLDHTLMTLKENVGADLFERFKHDFTNHITASMYNHLTGFDAFKEIDIIAGCTQFFDDLYVMNKEIQVLQDEYKYHELVNPNLQYKTIESLRAHVPLVISLPFSFHGAEHPDMNKILEVCLQRHIPLHIDSAWIPASKDICFNYDHPAIHSFAISMSKGYGTAGWNRIGVRWKRKRDGSDTINTLKDYHQITTYPVAVGLYFLDNLLPDHLWVTHKERNEKICKDFGLTQTKAIHMARKGEKNFGLSPLIRYLEYHNK